MKLSNVKLIVSDMDGTLLNSKEEVSDVFFQQFNQLQKLGIHFVAASGRQYHSIAQKLKPIKDQITIVGENGGVIKQEDQTLLLQTLDSQKVIEIIPYLRKIKDAFIILCSENKAFIESEDEIFIEMFQEYYSSYEIVKDLTKIPNQTPILKIALYHPQSSEQFISPYIQEFKNSFLLKISGKNWLDLSNQNSNKGTAIHFLQQKMKIKPDQTMVFGDYLNDLEMLDLAYFSYAMKNAHEDVKKRARFETSTNDDLGIEKIIDQVLKVNSMSNK